MSVPACAIPYKHALYPISFERLDETSLKIADFVRSDRFNGDTLFANADLGMLDVLPLQPKITRVIFFDLSVTAELFWGRFIKAIQGVNRKEMLDWVFNDLAHNRCDYGMSLELYRETCTRISTESKKQHFWLASDVAFEAVKIRLSGENAFSFKKIDFSDCKAILEMTLSIPKKCLSLVYLSSVLTYCVSSAKQARDFYQSHEHLQAHSPEAVMVESSWHTEHFGQQAQIPLHLNQPIYSFHGLTPKLIPATEVMPVLVMHGADPKKIIKQTRETPLHTCSNNRECARFLLSYGVPINYKNKLGQTALMQAAIEGKLELTGELLEAKADPKLGDNDGLIPAHVMAERGDLQGLQQFLTFDPKLATVELKPNRVQPIHLASSKETIELLKKYGANPFVQDSHQFTPLHWQIFRENRATVEALLELDDQEYYCTIKNYEGKTAMEMAHETLHLDLEKMKKSQNRASVQQ